MKNFRRCGWCDLLSLIAFLAMVLALWLPWCHQSAFGTRPTRTPVEDFGVPGVFFIVLSLDMFLRDPVGPGNFIFSTLFLGVAVLVPLFIAWASRHYRVAVYFALVGTALSIAFVFGSPIGFELEWPATLWCGGYGSLGVANALGARWACRRSVIDDDE